jgi:hypothetical protein
LMPFFNHWKIGFWEETNKDFSEHR